ncbi:MAG: hypothetical protein M3R25_01495 [Bacteroidota bacterium]|nr:hypothetical protein [Bacteroidota bacterium]
MAIDNESIYGDCVNLASRIEALSVPGAVLISDKVYDEIKNQSGISAKLLGKFTLKNVKRPVEIYGITATHLTLPTAAQLGVKSGSDKSIAVLPFLNMSADPENEYFSDGISEEILNALTHVDGLQVCSRSSSFTFKGKNKDVRQVGQKLGVASVLEGSVRRSGNRVRISCQLINTSDGYRIWSDVYDGQLDDIFVLQDEISNKIVNKQKKILLHHAHRMKERNYQLKILRHIICTSKENFIGINPTRKIYPKGLRLLKKLLHKTLPSICHIVFCRFVILSWAHPDYIRALKPLIKRKIIH